MLRTHRAGKGPEGCGRLGLRLKEQKGPRCVPHPWSRGQGTSPGSPTGFLGSSGQGNHSPLLSLSSWMVPPACLSWSPWPPSYALKDPHGLEGALEGRGLAWDYMLRVVIMNRCRIGARVFFVFCFCFCFFPASTDDHMVFPFESVNMNNYIDRFSNVKGT